MLTFNWLLITGHWLRRYRRDVIAVIVLFIIAALPRLTDLGIFLTADEKNWMGRSYEFIRAFKDWRFNDMMQTTHPGVTTMWLSGTAITLKMLLSHIPFSFRNLAHFAAAAQFPIALATAVAVPAIYIVLRQLLWQRGEFYQRGSLFALPLIASSFIALNPFLIGYSRVVHVDALLASLLFLAALATIIYAQREYSQTWLVVSAVLTGLAVLTKAPAVFMVPFFGLVVLVYEGKRFFSRIVFRERMRDAVLWLLLVVLLFVLLWPAILWVPNPEGNVLLLKRDIGRAAITPHHMVEDYTLSFWHYPATLLTRMTPLIQMLVALFLIWLAVATIKGTRVGKQSEAQEKELIGGYELRVTNYELRILWLLVAYVFFFVIMMTLGAKKGDRYLLPVFPALDVLAALGLVVAAVLLARLCGYWLTGITYLRRERLFLTTTSSFAAVCLVFIVYTYHPYAIAYSNPLFPSDLSQELGWGEGLEQVASWLNNQAPDVTVASWYPEELGAYTTTRVAHINAHEQGTVRYVVLYRNMFGRAPDHPANDFIDLYYKKKEPVFVAYVAGKPFAWVYEKRVFDEVVGELVEGKRVGQQLESSFNNLIGVEVFVATYNGRAESGELIVRLRPRADAATLHEWHVPIASLEDDRWLQLLLPDAVSAARGESFFVEVTADGTRPGGAPTVRYTSRYDRRASPVVFVRDGFHEEKNGDLGLRLLYDVHGEFATEDDTKLLR